mgnify:CR=1 FL=1|jgi:NADH:flavin oxidoreductases, Old Yellow Enzyme family
MPHLLSPLRLAHMRLPNRIALAPHPSGFANTDGFVSPALADYYIRRAQGGVGLLMLEPAWVTSPSKPHPHLGLYHDCFIPSLAALAESAQIYGGRVFVPLYCPLDPASMSADQLDALRDQFMLAAWRALAASCDGILLSAADKGVFAELFSPLSNQRTDRHGITLEGRLRLALLVVEGIRAWLGSRIAIAFSLNADEMVGGGLTLQDARVMGQRLVNAGVNMLDITVKPAGDLPVAQFPGWRVPLAAAVKRALLNVPVMTSGALGEPDLADSVIREGSADMVMIGSALRDDPDWPHHARLALAQT